MSPTEHRSVLYFTSPRSVTVEKEAIPTPTPDQVLVRTIYSAISAGTEMLFYRGQVPETMAVDGSFAGMQTPFSYPLPYGYAAVGEVTAAGSPENAEWLGRTVFAFHPHGSHFCLHPNDLIPCPALLSTEQMLFLPNGETAVSLVMDGAPLVGERVAVWGQGVVGLLVTSLLASFPLADLVAIDPDPVRREMAMERGATSALHPDEVEDLSSAGGMLAHQADLLFELSGNPSALAQATRLAGFGARIIVGSWYGTKEVRLPLGEMYHRNRVSLTSSQVSTLAPHLEGRWDKRRRLDVAMDFLARCQPESLIRHRFSLDRAAEAYALLDSPPAGTLQVIFTYENGTET